MVANRSKDAEFLFTFDTVEKTVFVFDDPLDMDKEFATMLRNLCFPAIFVLKDDVLFYLMVA